MQFGAKRRPSHDSHQLVQSRLGESNLHHGDSPVNSGAGTSQRVILPRKVHPRAISIGSSRRPGWRQTQTGVDGRAPGCDGIWLGFACEQASWVGAPRRSLCIAQNKMVATIAKTGNSIGLCIRHVAYPCASSLSTVTTSVTLSLETCYSTQLSYPNRAWHVPSYPRCQLSRQSVPVSLDVGIELPQLVPRAMSRQHQA